MNKFFESFCTYYCFKSMLYNPASRNENGNGEDKVGYLRNFFLVPEPRFNDLNIFNKVLHEEQLKAMQLVRLKEFDIFD